MRVVGTDINEAEALAHTLWTLGVTDVATIYDSDQQFFMDTTSAFENTFISLGGIVASSQSFYGTDNEVTSQLTAIKDTDVKVILVISFPQNAEVVYTEAEKLGMSINEDFQWIGTSYTAHDGYTPETMEQLKGMVGIEFQFNQGAQYESFLDLWESCNGQTQAQYAGCGDREPNLYAPFAYDAVYAFARALDNIIKAELDASDGDLLLQELYGLRFEGATGLVSFDSNGDRNSKYDVLES